MNFRSDQGSSGGERILGTLREVTYDIEKMRKEEQDLRPPDGRDKMTFFYVMWFPLHDITHTALMMKLWFIENL